MTIELTEMTAFDAFDNYIAFARRLRASCWQVGLAGALSRERKIVDSANAARNWVAAKAGVAEIEEGQGWVDTDITQQLLAG